MSCQESGGGSDIRGLLPSTSIFKQRRDKRSTFCNHCPIDVLIVAGQPIVTTVLHRQTRATRIKLRQEEGGRITCLEVMAVKSGTVVVSDEAAMLDQVVVQSFCKLLELQATLEEANPGPQCRCFLSGWHELYVSEFVNHFSSPLWNCAANFSAKI